MKTDRIVQSIAESLLDPRLVAVTKFSTDSLISRINTFISGMPPITQQMLKLLFFYFEWSAAWNGCFMRFSELSVEKRREYFLRFSNSRFRYKRDIARILKSLFHTAFFNLPELWNHLGYTPDKHLQQAMTERVLRLSAEQIAVEKARDRFMAFAHRCAVVSRPVFRSSIPSMEVPEPASRDTILEESVVMS